MCVFHEPQTSKTRHSSSCKSSNISYEVEFVFFKLYVSLVCCLCPLECLHCLSTALANDGHVFQKRRAAFPYRALGLHVGRPWAAHASGLPTVTCQDDPRSRTVMHELSRNVVSTIRYSFCTVECILCYSLAAESLLQCSVWAASCEIVQKWSFLTFIYGIL